MAEVLSFGLLLEVATKAEFEASHWKTSGLGRGRPSKTSSK
jgi:hypothetical protein